MAGANEEADFYESWEEMEDAGVLDQKLEKLQRQSPESSEITRGPSVLSSSSGGGVVFFADDGRTRYVPSEPSVKILKRPSAGEGGGGDSLVLNGDIKPRHPVKTLQQRELEYAEARLRIMGEARSPEEEPALEERIQKIQSKLELLRPSENENILRLPRGPDGTSGFNLRR